MHENESETKFLWKNGAGEFETLKCRTVIDQTLRGYRTNQTSKNRFFFAFSVSVLFLK